MVPSFTTLHIYLAYQFSVLRMRALRERLWARLTGACSELTVFPGDNARISPNRKLLGTQHIRVAQIVGTFNRETDFDLQFRPLHKHSQHRWVNAHLMLEQEGWPPILVHKIRNEYFVEDGHHRVSVARMLDMDFIDAKVWDYTAPAKQAEKCQPNPCLKKRAIRAYLPN